MPSATRCARPRMVVDRAYMSALLSGCCGDAPRPSPRGPLSSPPAVPDSRRGAPVTPPADAEPRTAPSRGRRPRAVAGQLTVVGLPRPAHPADAVRRPKPNGPRLERWWAPVQVLDRL